MAGLMIDKSRGSILTELRTDKCSAVYQTNEETKEQTNKGTKEQNNKQTNKRLSQGGKTNPGAGRSACSMTKVRNGSWENSKGCKKISNKGIMLFKQIQ